MSAKEVKSDTFAIWLETMLEENNMSQFKLAIEAEVAPQLIAAYIKGRASPRFSTLEQIVKVFGKKVVIIDE